MRYIVVAPNMQWIRHWRGEEYANGNLDVISEKNIIAITGRHHIEKIYGLRPSDDIKVIWLGSPSSGGYEISLELRRHGFKSY